MSDHTHIIRERIVLFGASQACRNFLQALLARPDLCVYEIVAIVDNDPKKIGLQFEGHHVLPPQALGDYTYDKIMITSSYWREIRNQLIHKLNIPQEKIDMPPKAFLLAKPYHPFADPEQHYRAELLLQWLIAKFNEDNIDYFVDHGTLLGLVREQRILPWDDDIDFSLHESSYTAACRLLDKHQHDIENIINYDLKISKYTITQKDHTFLKIDLHILNKKAEKLYIISIVSISFKDGYAYQNMTYSPDYHFLKKESISLWGLDIKVPYDFKRYLEFHYGDWKTVKQDASYMDLKNHIIFK